MEEMKLLIVEDSVVDLEAFNESLEVYVQEKGCQVNVIQCKNLEEARHELNPTFDGAIIDLKLGDTGGEGNQVIEDIEALRFRIPVIIFTGTPDAFEGDYPVVATYTKGEQSYKDILEILFAVKRTGLTQIMGGRGIIENELYKVFRENLMPHYKSWVENNEYGSWVAYGQQDSDRTEKSLLRHTLNHLFELLEDESSECFPEEVYLYPPMVDHIRTGSIVRKKGTDTYAAVMTPACDLVPRRNGIKTDKILLAAIDASQDVINTNVKLIKIKNDLDKQNEKRQEVIGKLLSNTHAPYFHWLPEAYGFPGGYINFRKLTAITVKNAVNELKEQYDAPHIQVAPSFMKDVLSRFSSFYARQGQPDVERQKIAESIFASLK